MQLVCRDIKAIFLPPNMTSLLQPMDQGVLQNIKLSYRKMLLQTLLLQTRICGNTTYNTRSVSYTHLDVYKRQEFADLISSENYSPQQVYNADETGLNFKALPTKSLASKEESSAPGFKMNKQRLTVLACSNAVGTNKLPLMAVSYTHLDVYKRQDISIVQ